MESETDIKEIVKLEGQGSVKLSGYSRNESQYGASFLLFPMGDSDKVYSISGFAAKQFDEIEDELFGKNFELRYETRHSDKFDKDYIVLTGVKVLKDRNRLNIEYEDE